MNGSSHDVAPETLGKGLILKRLGMLRAFTTCEGAASWSSATSCGRPATSRATPFSA